MRAPRISKMARGWGGWIGFRGGGDVREVTGALHALRWETHRELGLPPHGCRNSLTITPIESCILTLVGHELKDKLM